MGSQRKMSSSFKRGSLKSSTSGSQKVSELLRAGSWWAEDGGALPPQRTGLCRLAGGDGVLASWLLHQAPFREGSLPFLPPCSHLSSLAALAFT